jgi:hypothetical protein
MSVDDRDDPTWETYTDAFGKRVLPTLLASRVVLQVATGSGTDGLRVQAATEIGIALLLDKPLLLVIPRGETCSASLRRAAAVVVDDVDMDDPTSKARILAALEQIEKGLAVAEAVAVLEGKS